jgi:alkanesulfonate monooxygenase SsuD/methylene tetrahydromethanopterin reductase-like flavin-dependent oxidoreductase (luciferase family)
VVACRSPASRSATDRSVNFAAELGLQPCYWQPPPRRIRQRIERYAEIRSRTKAGRYPRRQDMRFSGTRMWPRPWRRRGERPKRASCRPSSTTTPSAGERCSRTTGEELAPGTTLDLDFLEPRNLLVGSPEHVVERVQELKEVCGLEYLLIGHGHPGIPQRLILRNLELFATKVMPAFKHSFGHRIPVA